MGAEPGREEFRGCKEEGSGAQGEEQGRGVSIPSGGGVGEGTATQVPLSRRFPLGQVQTGPLGLSRQSHSHFLRSQGLVTVGMGQRGRMLSPVDPRPSPARQEPRPQLGDLVPPGLPAPAWALPPCPPSGCLCWWYRTTSEA